MEKQKNSIDNFIREALKDHEIIPSDRAKEAFLKEASELPQRRRFRGGAILFIALVILVITGSVGFYYFLSNPSGIESSGVRSEPTHNPSHEKTSTPQPVRPTPEYSTNFVIQTSAVKGNQPFQPAYPSHGNKESAKIRESHSKTTKSIPVSATSEQPIDQNKDQIKTAQVILPETKNPPVASEFSDKSPTSDTSRLILNSSFDTIITKTQPADPNKEKKQRMNKEWYFSCAVQYTPEWMFNTLEEVKFVNNFGIEGIFTYGKYSIRTGLGLSVTKGTNEFAVEYNDYLGSYNKLDSMSFSWDGSVQDYIPTYYMKSQDVYDSLMKLDYPKIVKRYTYLQIPLVLGYDFLRSGRFSVGLRAGPVLSVLLQSKQLSEEYDPGNKKVISINNISPEQVSLNWQFMGGVNASVKLSRNLYLEIEPMAKYYFNSVYEKSEITKKPWSIGVRGAFIIKIN
jgi:hypothetical protein